MGDGAADGGGTVRSHPRRYRWAAAVAAVAAIVTLPQPAGAGTAARSAARTTGLAGGYWLVTATGSVFAFGTARYRGGLGQLDPARPVGAGNAAAGSAWVVGMAPAADGGGYWLVTLAGSVYAFGDAPYLGGVAQAGSIVGTDVVDAIVATPDGGGYWLMGQSVYAFGDATYLGSLDQLDPAFPPGGPNALHPQEAITAAAATG